MFVLLVPLALATFAVGTDHFVIAGLLPAIAEDLGVSVGAAGQLVTLFALTFAVSASVLGAVMSGLDRRTALLVSLGVFVAGNIGTAVGPSYELVMIFRVVTAVGAGTITSTASSTAAALAPAERRGWAMSLVLGGLSTATAVGLPLGTLIGGVDWRLTLVAVAALGAVAMIGIAWRLPSTVLPPSTLRQRLAPLRHGRTAGILVTTVLIFAGTYALYTYLTLAVTGVTAGSVGVVTAVFLAFGLGSLVGTLFSGQLTDRYSAERVLVVNLVVTVLVVAIGPLARPNVAATLLWVTVWGVCAAAATVPQQHRLIARESAAPILLGLNSSAIYVGVSLGGAVGGVLLPWTAPDRLELPAALFAALALMMTLAMGSRQKRAVHGPGVDHGQIGRR